jgi:TfoX/Sxy family transcriptional regulator of competence genes
MAYDEALASRIRESLRDRRDVTERKMFGGLAFLVAGHMCCGIVGRDLVVRVGREDYESALSEKHVRPMDFTGRPLRGMVYVAPAGLRAKRALAAWIDRGVRFTRSLAENARSAGPARKAGRPKPNPARFR